MAEPDLSKLAARAASAPTSGPPPAAGGGAAASLVGHRDLARGLVDPCQSMEIGGRFGRLGLDFGDLDDWGRFV
uniref:Uncharacterized protein n=1 Tax=Arundo donax TaxID=35708 RepID=A0A0A9AYZ2_ARUDO